MICSTAQAQHLFSNSGKCDTTLPLDFALGESFTAHTDGADIGFIPTMYFSSISSEKQLTDTAAIQVHFDNTLQQATIFMTYEMTQHRPTFQVCGIDGIVHIQGMITSMPFFISYTTLPAGVYILHVNGIPGRIPHITKWIKR